MLKITDVPCTCVCGWAGFVGECEPDIDGDGSLGCPRCLAILDVNVRVYKPLGPFPTLLLDDDKPVVHSISQVNLAIAVTIVAAVFFLAGVVAVLAIIGG